MRSSFHFARQPYHTMIIANVLQTRLPTQVGGLCLLHAALCMANAFRPSAGVKR